MHYNIQLSVQEVHEEQPSTVNSYGKTTKPAVPRRHLEIVSIKVSAETMEKAVAKATALLENS